MKKLKKLGLYGLLWSSLFTYPVYCFGVGLGNIQVNTHLNQPLQAIIPLHTLNDVSPTEIKVRLADTNAFEKAGLERPFYLTEIDFKVVERDNQTFIEISSVEPIQDPFLSFVLEANWASGRILREYTVLLDPPSKESVNLAHKLQPKIVPIPRATEKPKKETGEIFGPVGPEHTLWNIATVVSSKTGGDIHQSVIALAKKNPQAFIGGNINKLRKGTTLQLPNKEEVFQLSISEAIVQVKELITETKSLAKQPQEPIKPLESSMESQQRQPVVEKPLKLMVPGSTTSSMENKDIQSLNIAQMDAFQDRLLLIEEALDSLKRANHTLQFEQEELIGQNQTLLDLVNQKDEEISLLKQKLASLQSLDPSQKIQTPGTQKVQLERQVPEPTVTKLETTEPQVNKTQLETSPSRQSIPAATTTTPPAPSTSQAEFWSLRNFLIALLALGGLSALGYEIHRRKLIPIFRSEKEEDNEEFQPVKVETQQTEQPPAAKTSKEEIEQAFSVFEEAELKKDVRNAETPITEKPELTHILEDQNVLADADVYIAYERYDNAEQILKGFLEKHPGEIEAHIKLLELYKIMSEFDKVKAHIQEVGLWLSKNDKEGWQRIQDWQEQTHNAQKILAKSKEKNVPENAQAQNQAAQPDISVHDFHLDESQNEKMKQNVPPATPEFDLKKAYTLQLEPKQAGKAQEPEDKRTQSEAKSQNPPSANMKSALPDQESMETKLAVAQAYLDLGDIAGAKEHLEEVLEKGNKQEKQKAEQLLKEIKE